MNKKSTPCSRTGKTIMKYNINDTSDYHINDLDTLGWELTVCNSLESEGNPCRKILKDPDSFGNLLFKYLTKLLPFENIGRIIEIGGGYGYIMRDILSQAPHLNSVMLDISGFLLERQKITLEQVTEKGLNTLSFIKKDFFQTPSDFLKQFDLAILNENIGDFPVISEMSLEIMNTSPENLDDIELGVRALIEKYSLQIESSIFNFNLGAIQAVEKLCLSGIKYIYLSEHSCEVTEQSQFSDLKTVRLDKNPERIRLKGHDEYTVKFSHLEAVAENHDYTIKRGSYTDFIEYNRDSRINFIMKSNSSKDEHEILRHFITDLHKYEYLVLIKNTF